MAKTNKSTSSNEKQDGKLICLCALGNAIDVKSTGPGKKCKTVKAILL